MTAEASQTSAEGDDPLVGATIDGRYAVKRCLGRGGMGAVYEAEHVGTGRRVAVKTMLGGGLSRDPSALQRFQREARAAGKVASSHLAQVLDTGVDREKDLPYLVIEFLDGEDLSRVLGRLGPLPVDLALRIAAQALKGLDKAHRASIIHRDVKPGNVFLAREDDEQIVVKLLDFGIARPVDTSAEGQSPSITRTGALVGSPLYMSPEQARGHKKLDQRTDIWSLGVVLYELCAARTPHNDVFSLGDLIFTLCGTPAPPLLQHAPWVPPEVAAIVHRAIEIRPEDRYPSARAMLDDVVARLPGDTSIKQAMLIPFDVSGWRTSVTSSPAPPPPQAAPPPSSPPPAAALAVGVTPPVHASSVAGVVSSRGGEARKPPAFALVAAGGALVALVAGVAIWQSSRTSASGSKTEGELPATASPSPVVAESASAAIAAPAIAPEVPTVAPADPAPSATARATAHATSPPRTAPAPARTVKPTATPKSEDENSRK